MIRRIVQIAMTGHDENVNTQCEWTALALASDGTLWSISNRTMRLPSPWELVATIPQAVVPDAPQEDGDLEKARERLESVQRANLAVAVALRSELPRLLRLLRAGENAKGSLERCDEYMDQRADADLAPGGEAMQPNREMVLMQEIRAALREWDEAGK